MEFEEERVPPPQYRCRKDVSDSLLFPRHSSKARILSGAVFSAWASANFGYIVAFVHSFSVRQSALHVFKYGVGAFFLSLAYFSGNEILFGVLKRRYKYENFYVNYSSTALACVPLFTAAACAFSKVNFRQGRLLAYRYIGTLCCCSLVGEVVLNLSRYRYLSLSRPAPEEKNPFTRLKSILSVRSPRTAEPRAPSN